ncbi:hypothetical protein [Lichenibacterium dinghuense]|uniref:hypothetical protein n=1 Tax=Lichenibacterium dinghuense TaxID=2895977 RepID=UPI001F35B29B|nr:hypothetical protein [Lichenibacterium sp. 6Y81]
MEQNHCTGVRSAEGWRPPHDFRGVRTPSVQASRYSARVTMVTPSDHLLRTESGLEEKVAVVSLARPDVRDIVGQAAIVRYPGPDGKPIDHTLDFVEEMVDDSRVAMIVKPSATADKRGTRGVLKAVAAHAPASVATRFVLATENDVSPAQVANARLIHAVRTLGPAPDDPAVHAVAACVRGPMTIGEAVERSRTHAEGFRAAVRLLADRRLVTLSKGRITRRTLVGPAGEDAR